MKKSAADVLESARMHPDRPAVGGLPLLSRIGINRQAMPLTADVQPIQDVVEHFVKWDRTHATVFGDAQVRQHVCLELLLGWTDGDSAHEWFLDRFFACDALPPRLTKVLSESFNQFNQKRRNKAWNYYR